MKTCAIIMFWDCEEILPYCVDNWLKCVDDVIIVWSLNSNFGKHRNNQQYLPNDPRVICLNWEPNQTKGAVINERAKRNHGLQYAKQHGYTHFVTSDADEFYIPELFKLELEKFSDPNLSGLVCASQVYFKSPGLTIGLDVTLVPFIHKVTPTLYYEWNSDYPYAFVDRQIRIDPTRQFNIKHGIQWSDIIMHHYSYVRRDFEVKIKNSTAYENLERSTIREDLEKASPGYYCKFYQKQLIECEDLFGIQLNNESGSI
ncbi:MAG: hypothetical protein QOA70_08180 [Nitrososphaeraceae archaeon]|nr:hypothetical protein [Nitrososphaeraceae archaeon]